MENFSSSLLIAFAMILIIEGLVYALFPNKIKSMMRVAIEMPMEKLHAFGGLMLAFGSFFLWVLIH